MAQAVIKLSDVDDSGKVSVQLDFGEGFDDNSQAHIAAALYLEFVQQQSTDSLEDEDCHV